MNRYSRVFHHISLDDVKRNRLKTEEKQKIFLKSIREARNFLRDLNSPYYSDWRSNPIEEGMNTSNAFQTTFPGTGESNLENIDANNADAYTAAGGQDALNGTSIKASGTGEGSDGGFDLGQSYLAFDGDSSSRHAILDPIDSSKFDTMVINAIVGNDSNGGEDPDEAGEELRLYYLEPGGSSFRSISVNPGGTQVLPANADVLIDLGAGDGSLQQFSINLPSYARGEGFTYMLYQLSNSGEEFDHYGITNIKYQRRNPITLFVSLDSPEAVSFVNDGSGGLTPAQKKKRLEDMLAASDEYMDTMFPTNQEAMRRAEENLKRNIDISLDPNTFKFPEYGTPEYNQMFNPRMDADSDIEQIKNSLESKGLTLDNLDKDFNSQRGVFQNLGYDGTLLLLNNPDTQEQTLTAMGIDPGLVNNLTPDSFDKIRKITNLKPGGTPATGWDGKFYRYDDPRLEASRVIPLETYLQAKGTDNYAGIEKPDRAEPGKRYVMEKKYSFTPDNEATPNYVGVRNKDIEERNDRVFSLAFAGGTDASYQVDGHRRDYYMYTGNDPHLGGSKYMLRELANSAARSLHYINNNSDFLAYDFLSNYQNGEAGGAYKGLYDQYKDTDIFNNYDPLWVWNHDPKMSNMLTLLRGISSGRSLDSPSSYYYSGTDAAERAREDRRHREYNDRLYDDLQKALRLFDAPRTLSQYEKDEWYYGRDDDRVTEVRTTHPYSGLSEPEPTPEEPIEPEIPVEEPEEDLTDISKEVSSGIQSDDEVVDEIGKVGDHYKDKKIKNPEIQTPNLFRSLVNFFTGADDSLLGDVVPPAYEYGADIATSVLAGKPVNLTKNDVTTRDLELMFNQLQPNEVDVFSKPEAYADDNIRELPNGNVVVNTTGKNNTKPIYKPPTVTVGGQQVPTDFGYTNPIGAAGQAQVQLVVPSSNPRDAYFRYTDHAYYNDRSSDPGELPLGQYDPRQIPGALVNGISRAVYPNGLKGYPSNIRGDRTLKFDVSYDELPQNFKNKVDDVINRESLGGGSLGDTLQGTGAGDAATAAAGTQSKKKKKVTEMYEPKAKHNEKITKHPKMMSPKEFFKKSDIKPVYPDTPPPEMINGRHPDLVDGQKVSNRFNKLDPISAKAMPPTGNPHIDKKVRAAAKKPK